MPMFNRGAGIKLLTFLYAHFLDPGFGLSAYFYTLLLHAKKSANLRKNVQIKKT